MTFGNSDMRQRPPRREALCYRPSYQDDSAWFAQWLCTRLS